jgi:hypothetical protein
MTTWLRTRTVGNVPARYGLQRDWRTVEQFRKDRTLGVMVLAFVLLMLAALVILSLSGIFPASEDGTIPWLLP